MNATIREILKNFLLKILKLGDLSFEDKLLEKGIIDSLNFIEIILFIESKFKIKVNFNEFKIEHFKTINSLSEFIIKRMNDGEEGRDGK